MQKTSAPEPPKDRRVKADGTRLLVATMWEKDHLDPIRTRFPEIEMQVCHTYDEIVPKGDALKPQVLFAGRNRPGPFPRETVLSIPGVRWISHSACNCAPPTPRALSSIE